MLSVRLLGPVRIEENGRRIGTNLGDNTLALLAYLLLNRSAPVARSTVAVALWPDERESDALVRMRRYLFRLNGALPKSGAPAWIVGDKWSIQWSPAAPLWLDVDEFRRLSGEPTSYARALELYVGDLLSEYDIESLEGSRLQLRSLHEQTLLNYCNTLRNQGELSGALGVATRLQAIDPWREDVVRTIMRLRLSMGDRAGALQVYRDFAQRLAADLHVEPMAETIELSRTIASEADAPAQYILPSTASSFIGRDEELATLRNMLVDAKQRIITLLGVGGVGKSRLALEIAHLLKNEPQIETRFIELSKVTSSQEVTSALAAALPCFEEPSRPLIDTLCKAIAARRLLLIVDNCEHVLDGVAEAVAAITRACPNTTILATSREVLRIDGESRLPIEPLPVPTKGDHGDAVAAAAVPSIALFLERASKSARRPVTLSQSNIAHLKEIVRRLDGIPLAIELAASRLSALSLADLSRGLEKRFELLVGTNRNALPQHRTMRAAIDWSFQFLSESECRLIEFVSVFAGGMSLEAGTDFAKREFTDEVDALEVLTALVDKSLVIVYGDEVGRYRVLDSIASYSLERAGKRGEEKLRRLQHAEWICTIAERADAYHKSESMRDWLARYAAEMEDVRAAMRFCLDERHDVILGARIVAATAEIFCQLAPYEGMRWLESAYNSLPDSAPDRLVADICLGVGSYSSRVAPSTGPWTPYIERALQLYKSLGDQRAVAVALGHLVNCQGSLYEFDAAVETARAAVQQCREVNDLPLLQGALLRLGLAAGKIGEDDERFASFNEALRIPALPGDGERLKNNILRYNAYIEAERKDFSKARSFYREALESYRLQPDVHRVSSVRALDQVAQMSFLLRDVDSIWEALEEAKDLAQASELEIYIPEMALFAHAASGDIESAVKLVGYLGDPEKLGAHHDDVQRELSRLFDEAFSRDRFIHLRAEGAAMGYDALRELLERPPRGAALSR